MKNMAFEGLELSPWVISTKDILLAIFSPTIAIIKRPILSCSRANLHFFSPLGHCFPAKPNNPKQSESISDSTKH